MVGWQEKCRRRALQIIAGTCFLDALQIIAPSGENTCGVKVKIAGVAYVSRSVKLGGQMEELLAYHGRFHRIRQLAKLGPRGHDGGQGHRGRVGPLQNRLLPRLERMGAKTRGVRVSIMWHTLDDLDLQIIPPSGENTCGVKVKIAGVAFVSRRCRSDRR